MLTKEGRPGRVRWVALLALGAVTVGGAAAAAGSRHSPSHDLPAQAAGETEGEAVTYAATTDLSRAGLDHETAAGRVLEGLEPSGVVEDLSVQDGEGGLKVTVTLNRFDDDVDQVWIAEVASGALAELTRATDSSTFDALESAVVTSSAGNDDHDGVDLGVGSVSLGQRFSSPSDGELAGRVQATAREYGLILTETKVLHPLETALHVVFTVPPDASIDWSVDDLRRDLTGGGSTPDLEGILIELIDEDGERLLISGAAYRTGGGGLGFAPGEDGRFGAVYAHLPTE